MPVDSQLTPDPPVALLQGYYTTNFRGESHFHPLTVTIMSRAAAEAAANLDETGYTQVLPLSDEPVAQEIIDTFALEQKEKRDAKRSKELLRMNPRMKKPKKGKRRGPAFKRKKAKK